MDQKLLFADTGVPRPIPLVLPTSACGFLLMNHTDLFHCIYYTPASVEEERQEGVCVSVCLSVCLSVCGHVCVGMCVYKWMYLCVRVHLHVEPEVDVEDCSWSPLHFIESGRVLSDLPCGYCSFSRTVGFRRLRLELPESRCNHPAVSWVLGIPALILVRCGELSPRPAHAPSVQSCSQSCA